MLVYATFLGGDDTDQAIGIAVDQAVPATSTVNFDRSQYAFANGTLTRIGGGGQVCVSVGTVNSAPSVTQVILDATGYLSAGSLTQTPQRSRRRNAASTPAPPLDQSAQVRPAASR